MDDRAEKLVALGLEISRLRLELAAREADLVAALGHARPGLSPNTPQEAPGRAAVTGGTEVPPETEERPSAPEKAPRAPQETMGPTLAPSVEVSDGEADVFTPVRSPVERLLDPAGPRFTNGKTGVAFWHEKYRYWFRHDRSTKYGPWRQTKDEAVRDAVEHARLTKAKEDRASDAGPVSASDAAPVAADPSLWIHPGSGWGPVEESGLVKHLVCGGKGRLGGGRVGGRARASDVCQPCGGQGYKRCAARETKPLPSW